MKKRSILTIGLGFGDEGKASCIDHLCREYEADLVVRYCGGSQCGHNVVLPDGRSHCFSQWGSGTLLDKPVPTYLGPAVIISLPAMHREADHLEEIGVPDPFDLLSIHPNCLVSTVWHRALNQALELSRGSGRHGSCGHGIGETRKYWLEHGDDAIFAADLQRLGVLAKKLELVQHRLIPKINDALFWVDEELRETIPMVNELSVGQEIDRMVLMTAPMKIERCNLENPNTIVFEGAQGVLLDEKYGFHPHTTWSTVTPYHARELSGSRTMYTLGVMRSYATRHGNGPLPTEVAGVFPGDPYNPHNRWQGGFRSGYLDMPLLRYACEVMKLTGHLDGIAINHLNACGAQSKICTHYEKEQFLKVNQWASLRHQEEMGEWLNVASPHYVNTTPDDLIERVEAVASTPVVLRGYGPTHLDKKGEKFL